MKINSQKLFKILATGLMISTLVFAPLPIFNYNAVAQEAPPEESQPPAESTPPPQEESQSPVEETQPPAEESQPPVDDTQGQNNTGDQTGTPDELSTLSGTTGVDGESGPEPTSTLAYSDEDEEGPATSTEGVVGDENSSSTEEIINPGDEGAEGDAGEDGADGGQGGGTAVIDTGNAASVANLLNMVNLNIVDSEGWVNFMNLFGSFLGNVDLSGLSFPENACRTDECEAQRLEGHRSFENNNTSTISNDLNIGAGTGGNTIDGLGEIYTGDAAAAANVVNVVNTNIIRSNYLILALNKFGDWGGDLVLPGMSFFGQLFGGGQSTSGNSTTDPCEYDLTVQNDNQAEVVNNGETGAESGANEITEGEESEINTGNADAISNTTNLINSNQYNRNPIYILVRVTGRWNGHVFSTPPGLRWEETPLGILIQSDDNAEQAPSESAPVVEIVNTEEGNASSSEEGGDETSPVLPPRPCESSDFIQNQNNAQVTNNVNVFALTGENRISNGGGSYIQTGNAFAASNVINVVNTNIIGSNWILALINIFGDWDGNLAFGRPDLWVGTRALASTNPLVAGGSVIYTIDVTNNGDATATNIRIRSGSNPRERVKLNETHDNLFVSAFNSVFGQGEDEKEVGWEILSLTPGESKTLTYTSQVTDTPPEGLSSFDTVTTVSSLETDASEIDNTDKLTLMLQGATAGSGGGGSVYVTGFGGGYGRPKLEMSKTANASAAVKPSSTVSYKIIVKNVIGDIAREAGVVDKVYDPSGNMIEENVWDLGTIYSGEEIVIDYDVNFGASAQFGTYVNEAKLYAKNDYGAVLDTVVASSSIVIGEGVPAGLIGMESASQEEENNEESNSDSLSLSLFKPEIAMASPEPLPALEKAEYRESGLASIFSLFPWLMSNWLWWIILILIIAFYVWRRMRRKEK